MLGLRNILLEGRVEDARQYIEKAIGTTMLSDESEEVLGYFIDGDPSGNHKYLMWMVKMHDTDSGFSPNMLIDLVQRFHKNVDRLTPSLVSDMGYYSGSNLVLSPKNIDSYPDYRTLKKVVTNVESIQTRKEKEKAGKAGVDKLYEDNRWLLVKPNTYEGSCYYGSSTKWCTSSKDDPSHFKSYTKTGNLYYIIDKSKDVGDFFKIALHKNWNGEEQWYDRADNELEYQTKEAIRSLLPTELINSLEEDHGTTPEDTKNPKFTYDEFRDKLKSYLQNTRGGVKLKTSSGVWNLDFFQEQWQWTGPDPRVVVYATPFTNPNEDAGLEIYAEYEGDKEMDIDMHIPYHQLESHNFGPNDYLNRNPEAGYRYGSVERNLKLFLMNIYYPKVKEVLNNPELVEFLGVDYKTWTPESWVSSYVFKYPPKVGSMTKRFVDYVKQNPGKTSNEFYNDVLGYNRPRGHNGMFFAAIKDAGIVKMERRGRQFVYSLGPNHQAWMDGKLLRV